MIKPVSITKLNFYSLVPWPFPPPAFHRFQYGIRRGKAWEIWSRVMSSSRHKVDTRGAVPNEESQRPVLYCPSNGWISERLQGRRSIRSLFTTPGTDQHETGILKVGHRPRVSTICLPDVIACDQISQAFPRRISYCGITVNN